MGWAPPGPEEGVNHELVVLCWELSLHYYYYYCCCCCCCLCCKSVQTSRTDGAKELSVFLSEISVQYKIIPAALPRSLVTVLLRHTLLLPTTPLYLHHHYVFSPPQKTKLEKHIEET